MFYYYVAQNASLSASKSSFFFAHGLTTEPVPHILDNGDGSTHLKDTHFQSSQKGLPRFKNNCKISMPKP